ncbi:MAG: hypothetical protein SGJ27_26545 [Candidatus Melainabacteria bacterium]|nr:hypothetical protein [Candidatus Melainabacteria bacterium]
MTSQTWVRQVDVRPLASELEVAVSHFNAIVARMADVQEFLNTHKAALDEHKVRGRIAAAADTRENLQRVVDQVTRLRCSHQSGRLALFLSFSQLRKARLVAAKQVTKIVATMPHIADFCDRNDLGGLTLTRARQCEQAFQAASARHDSSVDHDPTTGSSRVGLETSFQRFLKDGSNSQAPDAERHANFVMLLIPIKHADINEWQLIGADLNDELVAAGNSALTCLQSEHYRSNWNQYFVAKDRLGEPQYAQRLLSAMAVSAEAVAVLKNQQADKRVEFLSYRVAVTRALQEVAALETRLSSLVGRLAPCVDKNDAKVPISKLVAMNNVLAGDAIARGLRLLEDKWKAELVATADIAEVAQHSLCDELAVCSGQDPFNHLRWIFGNDGRYIDLQRYEK